MAITQRDFTNNPSRSNAPSPLSTPDDPTKQSPQERQRKREQEKLQKEKDKVQKKYNDLNKKLEKYQSPFKPVTSKIREVAYALQFKSAEYDPNDDPNELYNQISSLLGKLGLRGRIDKGKGDIEVFENKKKANDEYLYKVQIRRDETLNKQDIDKLDREKAVEDLKWDNDGLNLYLWGPNTVLDAEQESQKPVPGAPKTSIPGAPKIPST